MVTKAKAKPSKPVREWICGSKKKGVSIRLERRAKPSYWMEEVWKNGKLARNPDDHPSKSSAISHAKSRCKMGWFD